MKTIYINEARVTLSTASQQADFYGISVTLPDELADAVLAEQERKFALSRYLSELREAGRSRTDPAEVKPPSFLEVPEDAEEPTTQPKAKRGRKPRVSQ